jgi:hypothetical protein
LRSLAVEPFSDVRAEHVSALTLECGERGEAAGVPSEVPGLNDSIFVDGADLLVELSDAFAEDEGRAPTLAEICRLLERALQGVDSTLITHPPTGVKIGAMVSRKQRAPGKVGDIVAIPAKDGRNFIAVIVARNRFGIALGLFKGTNDAGPISIHSHAPVEKYPVYTGKEFIESGRWKIVGHDDELLSLFPAEPEIYHYQLKDQPKPGIGPYGSGETAEGRLRDLSKEEAEEIGLHSEEYRAIYLPDMLEQYLNRRR